MTRPPLPRWILYAAVVAVVASWLPLAFIARARAVRSDTTRLQIVQDMDNQPRLNPQAASPVFADGRAMRPNVPGTIARGQLRTDDFLYRGKVGTDWATGFPMPVTEAVVRRGQERFNIFCAPCHGMTGAGNGPIHERAIKVGEPKWVPPTSLLGQQVRERAEGHVFNTITHGIRTMPAYAPQIAVEDRWAIVAYVRTLELSRDAGVDALPAGERDRLR